MPLAPVQLFIYSRLWTVARERTGVGVGPLFSGKRLFTTSRQPIQYSSVRYCCSASTEAGGHCMVAVGQDAPASLLDRSIVWPARKL